MGWGGGRVLYMCECISVYVLEGGDGVKVCVVVILSVSESVREFLYNDF